MGASGTGGTVVMLLASKEYGEKKKRFKGMQDDYRLRPNVWCKYRRKKKIIIYTYPGKNLPESTGYTLHCKVACLKS